MTLGRPHTTLEQKQQRLSKFIEELIKAREKYNESQTPSNKIKVLNLQNSIRAERYRINKQ